MYVPILKGMPGELSAWRYASLDVRRGSYPLFEVIPRYGLAVDLPRFLERLSTSAQSADVVMVDTSHIDQETVVGSSANRAITHIAMHLDPLGIQSVPVIGLSTSPAGLRDAGTLARMAKRGAALRLHANEWSPSSPQELTLLLSAVGIHELYVDLVLDFGSVASLTDVARSATISAAVLNWTDGRQWRSVTIASGAFPHSISHLPKGDPPTALDRFDAVFFDQVAAAWPKTDLGFGDFAVNNPEVTVPPQQGPLPNLRYAFGRHWEVYREERAATGNESFFTLCRRVVSSSFWPSVGTAYSWGDSEIESKSRLVGGPGGATQWRAYGTSHHLAHVIERLATVGAP
jgi:hypothetical protein